MLHEAHPGISRMHERARTYVWWPGIDEELESVLSLVRHVKSIGNPHQEH